MQSKHSTNGATTPTLKMPIVKKKVTSTSGPKAEQFPQVQGHLDNTVNYRPAWNIKNNDKILRKIILNVHLSNPLLVMGKEIGVLMFKSMCHRKAKV